MCGLMDEEPWCVEVLLGWGRVCVCVLALREGKGSVWKCWVDVGYCGV